MANCCNMKAGDVYVCHICGLELAVSKACTCTEGAADACNVPLQCCGKEMTTKN